MARKPFSELRARMSTESQARSKAWADAALEDLALGDLRRARDLTQQELASKLGVNQAWISRVERQADMYLSTLRTYLEAVGGQLEILVRFNDKTVRIADLEGISGGTSPRSTVVAEANASDAGPREAMPYTYQAHGDSQYVPRWRKANRNTSGFTTARGNTGSRTSKQLA